MDYWKAFYVLFALSVSFFMGAYNEHHKEENGWAFVWFIGVLVLTLKLVAGAKC